MEKADFRQLRRTVAESSNFGYGRFCFINTLKDIINTIFTIGVSSIFLITIVGMNMASLVCGSFIIESVFGWPGIGSFAMEAIGKRDYPVIMAYIMLSGFILVMGNFIADILYSFADPRIKRRVDAANGK